jgi:ketosteroid isomerase-like protein
VSIGIEEIRRHAELLLDALNRRDFEAIEQMEFFAYDARFNSAIAAAEGDTYLGVDGLRKWAANIDETWEDFRIELVRVVPCGEDRVVAELRNTGRARGSGAPLEMRTGQVWTWRDGVWIGNDSFTDARAAFETAGVPYEPSTRSA